MSLDLLDKILTEHLQSIALRESVREWMVIIKSGNYGNKRVLYSTDKKNKADEVFLDYRDRYPEHKFRVMTKTSFRDLFHRFPEYMPNHIKDKIFKKDDEIEINPDFQKTNYVYDPEEVEVHVHKRYDTTEPPKKVYEPRHKNVNTKIKRF